MANKQFTIKFVYIGDDFSGNLQQDPNIGAPLSLIALRNYLRHNEGDRFKIEFHEFPSDVCPARAAERIDPEAADIIGFSCYFWNIERSLAVAKKVHERNPDCHLILGGSEIEETQSIMEEHHFIDICVRGEGEEIFREVVLCLSENRAFPPLKGLTFRQDGGIKDNGGRGLIEDINTLPSIYTEEYVKSIKPGQAVHYYSERGCFCNCKYCTQRPPLRRLNIDRVEEEMKRFLTADNVTEIGIIDSDFSYDIERGKEILRIIKKYKKGDKVIRAHFGFLNSDDEILQLLRDNNIRVMTAFQSTSKSTLSIAGRSLTYDLDVREKILNQAFQILNPDMVNVAFIYGLPGDNYQTFGDSIRWAQRVGITDIWIVQLLALPGTRYRRDAEKYGIEHKKKPFYNVACSSTFSKHEMRKARAIIFWYYRMYRMLKSDQLKSMAARGVYVWDVAQHFPRMNNNEMLKYLLGKDRGDFVIKYNMRLHLNKLTISHLIDLTSKNKPGAKEILKLIIKNKDSSLIDLHSC